MMELVFVACLDAEPARCERRAIQFIDLAATTCVIEAQFELVRWASEHPGWTVSRWSCQPVTSARDA